MRFRVLWRRVATAVGIYGSVLFGILATIVAARELSNSDFARFALVFAITGLLQLFLDLTIDEVVVKYGNRYAARGDWGRFQRLFGLGLRVKLLGGVVGSLAIVVAALLSPWIWGLHGIEGPLLVASLIPIVQAPEGMASAALLIRNRYDVRAACLLWSMVLRFAAIVIGASIGVTATFVAIVIAQVVATVTVCAVGLYAHRRWPRAEAEPLGDHAKEIRSFAIQSTAASGLQSLRGLLPLVLVGVVATTSQVAYFRIAQAPQTAFASLSSPARMVMLAEQTRDIERGRHDRAWRLLLRYIGGAAGIVLVVVPLVWIWMEPLIRFIYGARYVGATDAARLMLLAAAVQLILGWTKSFPVSIGRPGLRTTGQAIEIGTLVPLVLVLGSLYGAAGAAGGVFGSSLVLAAFWFVGLLRMRGRPLADVDGVVS